MVYIARRLAAQIFPHQVNCAEKKFQKNRACYRTSSVLCTKMVTDMSDRSERIGAFWFRVGGARRSDCPHTPWGGAEILRAPPGKFFLVFWCRLDYNSKRYLINFPQVLVSKEYGMVGNNFRPLSSSMVAWSFRLVRARTVPCSTKYGMVGTSFRPFPSSTVAMVLAPGASPRCRMSHKQV